MPRAPPPFPGRRRLSYHVFSRRADHESSNLEYGRRHPLGGLFFMCKEKREAGFAGGTGKVKCKDVQSYSLSDAV